MVSFRGLLELSRPLEWSKSLMNMVFGSFLAVYVAQGAFKVSAFSLPLFVVAAASVMCLWSGLYALNDWTDHKKDRLHKVKRSRPIPSGRVSPRAGISFAVLLIAVSLALGAQISQIFLFCLAAMLANQLLYTIPPVKLKERPVLDLVSGSLVNPFFRFYAGWVLFVPAFNAPVLYLAFVLGLQFGGYSLYRLASRGHERRLGSKSSSVVFGEGAVKAVSYAAILVGCLAFLAMLLIPRLAPALSFLGVLPLRLGLLALGSAFLIPFYAKAAMDPQGMDMKRVYKVLYCHLICFLAGFVILFALF